MLIHLRFLARQVAHMRLNLGLYDLYQVNDEVMFSDQNKTTQK